MLRPAGLPGAPGPLRQERRDLDLLLTAETHNFPCAVAPLPGAETGAGGRIRDTHATGKGSLIVASTAGYAVGRFDVPGAPPRERAEVFEYPSNLADPLRVLMEASDGASDYTRPPPTLSPEPVLGAIGRQNQRVLPLATSTGEVR